MSYGEDNFEPAHHLLMGGRSQPVSCKCITFNLIVVIHILLLYNREVYNISLNWRDMNLMDSPLGGIGWKVTLRVAVNDLMSKWETSEE